MTDIISEKVEQDIRREARNAQDGVRCVWEMAGWDANYPEIRPILADFANRYAEDADKLEAAAELLKNAPRIEQRTNNPDIDNRAKQALHTEVARMRMTALLLDAAAAPSKVGIFKDGGNIPFRLTSDKCDLVPFGNGYLVMGGEGKDIPLTGFNDLETALRTMFGNSQLAQPEDFGF